MKLLPAFMKNASEAPDSPPGGRHHGRKTHRRRKSDGDRRSWHNTISGGISPHHHHDAASATDHPSAASPSSRTMTTTTTTSKFRHSKDAHHHPHHHDHHRGRTWHFPSPIIRSSRHSSHQEYQTEDFDWNEYKADHDNKQSLQHHQDHDDGLPVEVRESAFAEFKRKSNDPKTKPPRVEEGDEEEEENFAVSERTTTTSSLTAATTYKVAPRTDAQDMKQQVPKSPVRKLHSRGSSKGRKEGKFWSKIKKVVAHLFQNEPPDNVPMPIPRVEGGVLIWPCLTADEHRAKVEETLELVRDLYGKEGLRAAGFEYRFVACPEHAASKEHTAESDESDNSPVLCQNQKRAILEQDKQEPSGPAENGYVEENVSVTVEKSEVADNDNDALPEDGGIQVEQVTVGGDEVIVDTEIAVVQEEDTENEWELVPPAAATAQQAEPANGSDEVFDKVLDSHAGASCLVADEPCHEVKYICGQCSTRLFHVDFHTMVHEKNRKLYVADGKMYDAISRLCQEQVHEIMQDRFHYVWVTVCEGENDENDDGDQNPSKIRRTGPVQALVNPEHPLAAAENRGKFSPERLDRFRGQPTLLIITGKGKVRAGVFSRQHLLISGMEASTALPLLQEAQLRELNVVVLDPNIHGDDLGLDTTEKSLSTIFMEWEQESPTDVPSARRERSKDLYILSHSQSGAHLARYLLEKSKHYLPCIRAIVFTDSTHNLQWPRKRGNQELCNFLESPACIYFRCAKGERNPKAKSLQAGAVAPTDQFWQHRFGKIATYWAGTSEHSLANWFAHRHIWDHFDKFLKNEDRHNEPGQVNEVLEVEKQRLEEAQ